MRRALVGIWVAIAALYAMGSLFGPPDEKAEKSTLHSEVVNNPTPPSPLSKPQRESEASSSQTTDFKPEPTARAGSKPPTASGFTEEAASDVHTLGVAEEESPKVETTQPLPKSAEEATSGIETSEYAKESSPEVETTQPLSRKSASGKKNASASFGVAGKRATSRLKARTGKQKIARQAKEKKARKRDVRPHARYGSVRAYPRPYVYYRPYARPYLYYRPYPRPYVYYRPYASAPYALRRYRNVYGY